MNTASPMPDEAIPGLDDMDPTMHEPLSRAMQEERALNIARANGATLIFSGEVAMSTQELANTLKQVEREAIERAAVVAEAMKETPENKWMAWQDKIAEAIRALLNQPGQEKGNNGN